MVVLESYKSTQCGTAEFDVLTNSLHCGKQIIGFPKEGSWLLRFLIAHSLRLPRLEVRHITVSKSISATFISPGVDQSWGAPGSDPASS
jgi:hypothetical protein